MKNILLLGATGSIGDSVLNVISQNEDKFNLFGISFNNNIVKAKEIIKEFNPKYVYINDIESFETFLNEVDPKKLLNGERDLQCLIKHNDIDIIICATTGFAGLEAVYIAATTGKKILLANKESIVVAGEIIFPLAKKHKSEILF